MSCIEALVSTGPLDFDRLPGERFPIVVADLALGAWKPHSVAREFLEQLSPISKSAVEQTPLGVPAGSLGDLVGRMIDLETSGSVHAITAYNHAHALGRIADQSGPFLFIVIGPPTSDLWDTNTTQFLTFFSERAQCSRILIIVPNEQAVPKGLRVSRCSGVDFERNGQMSIGSVAGAVPGIFDEETVAVIREIEPSAKNQFLQLRRGLFVLRPDVRFASAEPPSEAFNLLVSRLQNKHWLTAFALWRGGPKEGVARTLYRYAGEALWEGDIDLGLRLLDTAFRYAIDEMERWIIASQLQGMRIATGRFSDGLVMGLPPLSIPSALRAVLLQSKAWCLVMSGRPADADPLFQEAMPLLETIPPSRFFLYVLNIYALTCLRLGRIDQALVLEQRIESEIARHCPDDHHLIYINSLNIARLMRRLGRLDAAGGYYHRAFETCTGLCSESDFVFKNSCQGFLADLRGDNEASCSAWIRTACHWLAMEVPESLAPRVVRICLDGQFPPNFVDLVSDLVRMRLSDAATRMGFCLDTETPGTPVFAYREKLDDKVLVKSTAMGSVGWGLLRVRGRIASRTMSDSQALLARTVARVIQHFVAVDWDHAEGAVTFVIDHQSGKEMPLSRDELLLVALNTTDTMICWERCSPEAVGPVRPQILARVKVKIGPAVKSVQLKERPFCVDFKRYRLTRYLSETEAGLLARIESQPSFGRYDEGELRVFEQLRVDRIVELVMS